MSWIDGLRHRVRILLARDAYDRELQAERAFHLSLERMHQESDGAAVSHAASMARRRYGNVTVHEENVRRLTPLAFLEQVARDTRYTMRQLWRAPVFSFGVIGTFALGIGANAAMFDVLDRLLLRAPAFLTSPNETHRIFTAGGRDAEPFGGTNYRRFRDLSTGTSSFDVTAAFWSGNVAVGSGADLREVFVEAVSASYWSLFTMRPVAGRFFTSNDDVPPLGTRVVVLGYDYWMTAFGGRPDAIGRSLQIGTGAFQVIGVAPAGFRGLDGRAPPSLFVPVTAMASHVFGSEEPAAYATQYGGTWLTMVAHRKAGVSEVAANADLTVAYNRSELQAQTESASARPAPKYPWHAMVAPVLLERGPSRSRNTQVVLWLAGVACIVLLIACANVANLLVARVQQRAHEFSVRAAIGVRRRRLLEQLVTETLVLALLGAAAGLLLSAVIGSVLRTQLLGDAAKDAALVDLRVVLFTLAIACVAGVLSGAYPAWQTTRGDIVSGLKAGPRAGGRSVVTLRAVLLATQTALSVLLLVGAGEFLRSMRNVNAIPLGFDPDRVLYVNPRERSVSLSPAERDALLERIVSTAQSLPGVQSAARGNSVPFWNSRAPSLFRSERDSLSPFGQFVMQAASPDYFATMGTSLLRGRGISPSDGVNSEKVLVVSDSMAARLWPGRDALGECVRVRTADEPCRRVVGIASAIRRSGLMRDDGLQYYIPVAQYEPGGGGVFIRTRDDAGRSSEGVRNALQVLVPGDGYLTVLPLRKALDRSTQSWRLGATLFTAFGALALLLACGGLYSVIAYDVTRRTHELGVRMALGARRTQIVGHVLRDTLRVAVLGVGVGLVVTAIASRWMKTLLFGVSPVDPLSCAVAVCALLVAMTVAAVLPAHRAARIEPADCLRVT